MESILFVPTVAETTWLTEILPDMSLAELPVAGRMIIDYQLEQACRFGVSMAEVLDWNYSERLNKNFSDLTAHTLPIFYCKGKGAVPRGLKDIEHMSSPLTGNMEDGLVVVWGLCLSSHAPNRYKFEEITEEEFENTPMGVYRLKGGKWTKVSPRGMTMRSTKAWQAMNFVVMRDPREFTLPGYMVEHGAYIGRNVGLEIGTNVKGPVILQDNAWCARNVSLEGYVVVGKGAFISEGARLRRTIIGADTYIGSGLDLENKIVIGRRVIDAKTGTWTDIEEAGMARSLNSDFVGFRKTLRRIWRFLIGASHGGRHERHGQI